MGTSRPRGVEMTHFVLGHIGNALRHQFDDIANEPLPEPLVELINLLNEQEQGQQGHSGAPSSSRPLNAFIESARHHLMELQHTLKDTQRQIDHVSRLLMKARGLVTEE
jgi:hypothetical protein